MNLAYNCLLVLYYELIANVLYFQFNYGVFLKTLEKSILLKMIFYSIMEL